MTAGTDDRLATAVMSLERALEMLRKEQFERAKRTREPAGAEARIAHALGLLEFMKSRICAESSVSEVREMIAAVKEALVGDSKIESSDVSAANTSMGAMDPESSLGRL